VNLVEAQTIASCWLDDGDVAVPLDHVWRYRRNVARLHPAPLNPMVKAAIQQAIEQNREALDRLAEM